MATLLSILTSVVGIANFVLLIIVLIKLYQEKGLLHGILGLICGLYTFIWGWMNVTRLNIKNIMMAWTACIVLSIILGSASAAMQ